MYAKRSSEVQISKADRELNIWKQPSLYAKTEWAPNGWMETRVQNQAIKLKIGSGKFHQVSTFQHPVIHYESWNMLATVWFIKKKENVLSASQEEKMHWMSCRKKKWTSSIEVEPLCSSSSRLKENVLFCYILSDLKVKDTFFHPSSPVHRRSGWSRTGLPPSPRRAHHYIDFTSVRMARPSLKPRALFDPVWGPNLLLLLFTWRIEIRWL